MSDDNQTDLLREPLAKGPESWNEWRSKHPEVKHPYLVGAPLHFHNLQGANLRGANLYRANLQRTILVEANLSGANLNDAWLINASLQKSVLKGASLQESILQEADCRWADFERANLKGAKLYRTLFEEACLTKALLPNAFLFEANMERAILESAILSEAYLYRATLMQANLRNAVCHRTNMQQTNLAGADLSNADLTGANLKGALLEGTNIEQATLTGCQVYGISAWNIHGTPKDSTGLIITHEDEPTVTVDDIRVAQFIYLLLKREILRNVIESITSKAVLILGRFTQERKGVLDALAEEARRNNLLPIVFDFERATSRDFTETVKILAGLSLFVVADITKPRSVPKELEAIVPDYKIPFVPIIEKGEKSFSMFQDVHAYDWVLPLITYPSIASLRQGFKSAILDRAWVKHQDLLKRKTRGLQVMSIDDFLHEPRNDSH